MSDSHAESAEELARSMLEGQEMRRFLPPATSHLPEFWPSLQPAFDPIVDPVPPPSGLLGRVRNRLRRLAKALLLPGLRLWARVNRLAARTLPPEGPPSAAEREATRRADPGEVVGALGQRLNQCLHQLRAVEDRLARLEQAAAERR